MFPESVIDACATIRTYLTNHQAIKGDTRHDNIFHRGRRDRCVPELKPGLPGEPVGEHVPPRVGWIGRIHKFGRFLPTRTSLLWRACNRSCQSGSVAALPPSTIHFFGGPPPPAFVRSSRGRRRRPRSHFETARLQSARASGCHLSGETPSRMAEKPRLPAPLSGHVRRARAVRPASDPSSAIDPRRDPDGRIAAFVETPGWPRLSHPRRWR